MSPTLAPGPGARALTACPAREPVGLGTEPADLERLGRIDALIAAALALGVALSRFTRGDRNRFKRLRIAVSPVIR